MVTPETGLIPFEGPLVRRVRTSNRFRSASGPRSALASPNPMMAARPGAASYFDASLWPDDTLHMSREIGETRTRITHRVSAATAYF